VFILAGLPLIGFGIGFIMPNMSVWLANISPLALRGRLMGGYAMAVFFGQFISPFVTQPMVNTFEIPGTYLLIGVMLLVLGVVMVGGTWLNRQKR
jgi:MFS family permease